MDFWLVSGDGTRLHGDHRPPLSRRDHGLGVVLVPGFASTSMQPRVSAVAESLRGQAGVLTVNVRGHGRSGGRTTLAWREPEDAAAAVSWMSRYYERVALIGFSMGAAVVLRTAALHGGVSAVAAVSGPAFWYYRGTSIMRRLHRAVESPVGRFGIGLAMRTRVSGHPWPDPPPMSPVEAAEALAPTPLLIVHGDRDAFFPLDHPRALHAAGLRGARAAGGHSELWIEPDFGHAEGAISSELSTRIGAWLGHHSGVVRADGTEMAASRLGRK